MSLDAKIAQINKDFSNGDYEYSDHAQRRLDKRGITDEEIREAALNAQIMVCTVTRSKMLIITLYEPNPAKFISPAQRRLR